VDIKQIKKKLKIGDKEIAEAFGYKNAHSFRTSARRQLVEQGIIAIYKMTVG